MAISSMPVCRNNNMLYAASNTYIGIYSLDSPALPSLISTIDGFCFNFTIVGDLLYSVSYGLTIYNISNPNFPVELGTWSYPDHDITKVVVQGNRAYLISWGDNNVIICDISNPSNPHSVGTYNTYGQCLDVKVLGAIAAVSSSYCIYVVEISDPAQPLTIGTIPYEHVGSQELLSYTDGILITSDNVSNQIRQYDLSTWESLSNPVLEHETAWNLSTYQAEFLNGIIYTANGAQGVSILDYQQTPVEDDQSVTPKVKLTCYPNPFNPETTISYDTPKDGPVQVTIYNLKGQVVKKIIDQLQEKGNHQITWNGLDDRGRKCSSGMYMLRLTTPSGNQSRKVVLLK
jgi:hypothetical protein